MKSSGRLDMENITWEIVVLLMGGLVTILTFLASIIKKSPKKEDEDALPHKLEFATHKATVDQQIKEIKQEIFNLKQDMKDRDEKTLKSIEKLESKIEKFTDIIVDHIRKN